jgi:uncharacterized protein YbjT (DUF2867 family)
MFSPDKKEGMYMNTTEKTILVIGATGQQGGAVVRQLLAKGWQVRALSRNLKKPAVQTLIEKGVTVMQGDLDDAGSLRRALEGVYGVFSVITVPDEGPEGEERQGKALANAAYAAGVEHLVYSSVGGADRQSGVPHFESKWNVEQHIRSLSLPQTILRPAFFMDNFLANRPKLQDGVLTIALALRPETKLQMISVDDIGAFASLAFERPQDFQGKALEIAGDELTMPQVAEIFSRLTGYPARFIEIPNERIRSVSEDLGLMFTWFEEHGYAADIPALRALYPQLASFETWAKSKQWVET